MDTREPEQEPTQAKAWEQVRPVVSSEPVPIPEPMSNGAADDAVPSFEDLLKKRQDADAGHWFKLTRTGGRALVRRFTSTDRIAIGQLPHTQQQKVLNAIGKMGQMNNAVRSDGSVAVSQALKNMGQQEELINAYCVVGFIKPPLIFSEKDRTSPDQIPVELIDLHDRQMYFSWCETDNEVAAARVDQFPDEPPGDVVTG